MSSVPPEESMPAAGEPTPEVAASPDSGAAGDVRPSRGSVVARGFGIIAASAALLACGVLAWITTLPSTKADGSCDGIGFGCTPNQRDGMAIVAMIMGLPALAVLVAVQLVVLTVLAYAGARSGLRAGIAAVLTGWVLLAAVLAAVATR
ncbi:hypothetical protein [Catellatospora citrea]|nr:hypothetical protein [Catellatospora citrea]RKE10010.1 hypothetical protein C8E86_4904 [Catellatospora citrea]